MEQLARELGVEPAAFDGGLMRRREFLLGAAGALVRSERAAASARRARRKPVAQAVTRPKIDGDLLIFNWTEYMNPRVIKRFEKQYGVSVTVSNFDSMPGMMAKLRAGNRYDLIFPTADYVAASTGSTRCARSTAARSATAAASTRSSTTPGTTRTPPTPSRTACTRPGSPGARTRSAS